MITPPTDNLYRFMAIAGLVLIGVSGFYAIWLHDKSGTQLISIEQDFRKYKIDAENHDYNFKLMEEKIKTSKEVENKIQDNISELEQKASLTEYEKKLIEEHKQFLKERREHRTNQIETLSRERVQLEKSLVDIKASTEMSAHYLSLNKLALIYGSIGTLVGIFISAFGFNRWLQHEKLRDYLLEKEAANVGWQKTPSNIKIGDMPSILSAFYFNIFLPFFLRLSFVYVVVCLVGFVIYVLSDWHLRHITATNLFVNLEWFLRYTIILFFALMHFTLLYSFIKKIKIKK